jgi:hypothetical protein
MPSPPEQYPSPLWWATAVDHLFAFPRRAEPALYFPVKPVYSEGDDLGKYDLVVESNELMDLASEWTWQ